MCVIIHAVQTRTAAFRNPKLLIILIMISNEITETPWLFNKCTFCALNCKYKIWLVIDKMKLAELQENTDEQLLEIAIKAGAVEEGATPRRLDLMRKIFKVCTDNEETITAVGILSILSEGYGFLRQNGEQRGSGDVYVSQSQIRRFNLRAGDYLQGLCIDRKSVV